MQQMGVFFKVIFKYWHWIVFCIAVVAFIIIETPFLNRPYYWDEAWSYASAVKAMYDNGPSLMPGAIHEYLYRGHPTFFYFTITLWMKVFGPSLFSTHLFFLLLSIAFVVCTFLFVKKIYNIDAALIASLVLLATPLFLAQTTFMLPEMMLAFLSLLTLYAYVQRKIFLEILFGSMLVLTKETGMVLVCILIFHNFVSKINTINKISGFVKIINSTVLHSIPLFIALLFFVAQKIKMGWFLYPEHIGMMTLDPGQAWQKIVAISRTVFQLQGRIILLIFSISGSVLLLILKKFSPIERRLIFVGLLFMIAYIVFSALNFYTVRYILSVLPVFFILSAIVLVKLFEKRTYISYIVLSGFLFITVQDNIKATSVGDTTLSFADIVTVHKNAISYCEQNNFYEKNIQTHFLMLYNLQEPFMGYLQNNKPFKRVSHYNYIDDADVVIISSIETPQELANDIRQNKQFVLAKKFEKNIAWCEVYVKSPLLLHKPL